MELAEKIALPQRPVDVAFDREMAALQNWGTESQRLRGDRALNDLKGSPAFDAEVARRDLNAQLREGPAS